MISDLIHGDRRARRRYPIELYLEYRIFRDGTVVSTGSGRTLNISSGGILFQPLGTLPGGSAVELSIRWPAALGNATFIELTVSGHILRSDDTGTVVRTIRYHFGDLTSTALLGQIFQSDLVHRA